MRRLCWKLYFYLAVLLTVGVGATPFLVSSDITAYTLRDIALWPLYVAQLVGLYGYVYVRRIGSCRIWQLIFVVSMLDAFWMAYEFTTSASPAELGSLFVVTVAAAAAVLILPLWLALYSYAFRSESLWANAT